MDPINIPQMLAYIPAPWILWVSNISNKSPNFGQFRQPATRSTRWHQVPESLTLAQAPEPVEPPVKLLDIGSSDVAPGERIHRWVSQWIGLGENLQENPYLMVKIMVSCKFPLKPIH